MVQTPPKVQPIPVRATPTTSPKAVPETPVPAPRTPYSEARTHDLSCSITPKPQRDLGRSETLRVDHSVPVPRMLVEEATDGSPEKGPPRMPPTDHPVELRRRTRIRRTTDYFADYECSQVNDQRLQTWGLAFQSLVNNKGKRKIGLS